MIIFRAGLTGCLAAVINNEAIIQDSDSEPTFHKAVLRFRSDAISQVTGIPFQKIKVSKAVYSYGKFVEWSPLLANQYSKKVIDGIYDRSIDSLEPVIRWLAPENFHEQLLHRIGDRVHWDEEYDVHSSRTKISTLPMPKILELLGEVEDAGLRTNFNSIHVTTYRVLSNCDVHQTIYIPDPDDPVYRATLEGDKIIIESRGELDSIEHDSLPYELFSLAHDEVELVEENYTQNIGKIAPINDIARKEIVFRLTDNHGIYSLGRTAIWKNILLDDCLRDIQRINTMIKTPPYERALGK